MFYGWNYTVSGNQRYDFIMMHTGKSIGGRNRYAFLKVLRDLCADKSDDITISDYAYNNADGKYLHLTTGHGEYKISEMQTGYGVFDVDGNQLREIIIPHDEESHDTEDRIEMGKKRINELRENEQGIQQ